MSPPSGKPTEAARLAGSTNSRRRGERHLEEWATVLEHVSKSMARFVKETRETLHGPGVPKTKSA